MANKYAPQAAFNWPGAPDNWCDADDGVQDVAPPGAGDVAIFTVNSGAATMDNNVNIGGLTMTGFTGSVSMNNDIDCDGVITNLSGTFTGGGDILVAGHVTVGANLIMTGMTGRLNFDGGGAYQLTAGVRIFGLILNAGSTVTLQADSLVDNFQVVTGTFADGGNDFDIAGSIICAGTITTTGDWTMSGTGSLINAGPSNALAGLNIAAGVVGTLIGTFYCRKLAGSGTYQGANLFYVRFPPDNFWSFAGTASSNTTINLSGSRSSGAGITLNNALFNLQGYDGNVLTMDGDLNTGTGVIRIYGSSGDRTVTLDMVTFDIKGGESEVVLGTPAASAGRWGKIDFGSGYHQIASLRYGNAANNAGNGIDFGTADVECSGNLNATGIAAADIANTNGTIRLGTITALDMSVGGTIQGYGSVDGTGNSDVEFAPAVGSLAMCGVGV
ncbi:hypothetical protein LCGC14_0235910 [marine sediment metagenome]|uniref:G8 domain-containing protein n=1 Tax=marine sediment metagenome TaxID=412755 RepID=A0A0F9U934_9ZZZZ